MSTATAQKVTLQRIDPDPSFGALTSYEVQMDGLVIGTVHKFMSGHYGKRWNGSGYYDYSQGSRDYFSHPSWTYSPFNRWREEFSRRKDGVLALIGGWKDHL